MQARWITLALALFAFVAPAHGQTRVTRMRLKQPYRQVEVGRMANTAPTATTWIGTTEDATLGSNWTDGVPNGNQVFIGATPTTSLTGFGAVAAQGLLEGTTNFAANDTVIIDSKTYTYKASSSADGEVTVGGDLGASYDNLHDAINLVSGGDYGASMTIHPTVRALSNTALNLSVAAKDAGTGGNAITVSVGANTGDSTWTTGATLVSGAAVGNVFTEGYTDGAWPGDINSSGNEAEIDFAKFFHRGNGTIYMEPVGGLARIIVDSTNLVLAAQVVLDADGLTDFALEVVRGTATLNQNGVTGTAHLVDITKNTSTPSKLTITGAGTIGTLRQVGGFLVCNGPTITDMITKGGRTQFISGTATMLVTASLFELESTDTMAAVELLAGTFDMTTTAAAKTVTAMTEYPAATLIRRTDFDVITNLRRIGVD